MGDYTLPLVVFVILYLDLLRFTASSDIVTEDGALFHRVLAFNNRKVTTDTDAVYLLGFTLMGCAGACSRQDWCTSFFYTNDSSRACSLHETVFMETTSASSSQGTRYYKHFPDWCPMEDKLLYIRQAEMCVYFEQNSADYASSVVTADAACQGKGMRVAHSITPTKMEALSNITKKNPGSFVTNVYIGLRRTAPGETSFVWVNGDPLNEAHLLPHWETDQPNGHAHGQDCVALRATTDHTLNDVTCGTLIQFVCEKSSS